MSTHVSVASRRLRGLPLHIVTEPPTSFKNCLRCGTQNEFVLRFDGYRCTSCKEYSLYLKCPGCATQFFLFGPFATKGPTHFVCPNCKKKLQMDRALISRMKETIRAMTSARAARIRYLSGASQRIAAAEKRMAREESARQKQEQIQLNAKKREEAARQKQKQIQLNAKKREDEVRTVQIETKKAEQQSWEIVQRLGAIRTLIKDAVGNPRSFSFPITSLPKPNQAAFKTRTKKPESAPKGTPPAPPSTTKPRLEDFSPSQIPGAFYTPDDLQRRKEQFDSTFPAFDEATEKYEREVAEYRETLRLFEQSERDKQTEFEEALQRYNLKIEEEQRRYEKKKDAELTKWKAAKKDFNNQRLAFSSGQPEAVTNFFSLLLNSLEWPVNLKGARVAFSDRSSQLVVELVLPTLDEAIPSVASYQYSQRDGRVVEKLAPIRERKADYLGFVSQAVLRVAFEVFRVKSSEFVTSAVISGVVEATDPRTGNPVRPCLVTLRVSRDDFLQINLAKVDPVACLTSLKAAVSRSPDELVAVKPIVEFDMVDPRFVKEANILTGLDTRPNLMELTPSEFESLVTNLFENMGLETRLTQASRDGGVDCVAWDTRPIFGGKVIIQAKRYKNTVGPSAVRDLFGAMHNEGATKGILITTSGYGPASYQFADNKPLELLDGANLLYLLKEHAGVDAKIEVPDDWVDPIADSGSDF
jgi:restriction system protein